jgi:hypothetical protein
MSTTIKNGEPRPKNLTTADLAASANKPRSPRNEGHTALGDDAAPRDDATLQGEPTLQDDATPRDRVRPTRDEETNLAPLFAEDVAIEFRSRWDVVQRGFVDDPKQSVRAGDELVAQVIKSLTETFSGQRTALEGDRADQASTENLRLALRRYRSFFERLLSI